MLVIGPNSLSSCWYWGCVSSCCAFLRWPRRVVWVLQMTISTKLCCFHFVSSRVCWKSCADHHICVWVYALCGAKSMQFSQFVYIIWLKCQYNLKSVHNRSVLWTSRRFNSCCWLLFNLPVLCHSYVETSVFLVLCHLLFQMMICGCELC